MMLQYAHTDWFLAFIVKRWWLPRYVDREQSHCSVKMTGGAANICEDEFYNPDFEVRRAQPIVEWSVAQAVQHTRKAFLDVKHLSFCLENREGGVSTLPAKAIRNMTGLRSALEANPTKRETPFLH
jgi:hypothetical protein